MCFLYNMEMIAFLNAFKIQGLLFYCPLIVAKVLSLEFAVPLQTFHQKKKGGSLCYPCRRWAIFCMSWRSEEGGKLQLHQGKKCCLQTLITTSQAKWLLLRLHQLLRQSDMPCQQ